VIRSSQRFEATVSARERPQTLRLATGTGVAVLCLSLNTIVRTRHLFIWCTNIMHSCSLFRPTRVTSFYGKRTWIHPTLVSRLSALTPLGHLTSLLKLRSLIFGVTLFVWLCSITLMPYFWWEYFWFTLSWFTPTLSGKRLERKRKAGRTNFKWTTHVQSQRSGDKIGTEARVLYASLEMSDQHFFTCCVRTYVRLNFKATNVQLYALKNMCTVLMCVITFFHI
jgi:hypothetical protein